MKSSNTRAVMNSQGTFLVRVSLFRCTGSPAVSRGCLAEGRTEAMRCGRSSPGASQGLSHLQKLELITGLERPVLSKLAYCFRSVL